MIAMIIRKLRALNRGDIILFLLVTDKYLDLKVENLS